MGVETEAVEAVWDVKNGRGRARRALAAGIVGVWAAAKLASVAATVAAGWSAAPEQALQAAEAVARLAEDTETELLIVLAFYFAGPHVGSVMEAISGRLRGPRPPA